MKNFKNNWYVYFHRKPNSMEIFYIGLGMDKECRNRCNSSYNRNKHWHNIVAKYKGFVSEIVQKNLSYDNACELEIFLIEEYGLENLCNITKGGEGCSIKHTLKSREKMKKSHLGVQLKPHHVEAIKKSRKYGAEHWGSRKVLNTYSNEIYNTIKEAAEKNGYKYTTLYAMLIGQNKNRTNLKFL